MSINLDKLSYIVKHGKTDRIILNNICLNIEDGELIAIVGRTGSGKSTLVELMCGLLTPTSGNIKVNEIQINKGSLQALRKIVGIVFQFPEHQLFEETVYKDIAFGLNNLHLDEITIRERIIDVCKELELSLDVLEKSPFELSDGDKRKAAIAGVLVMKPDVLIFDEPAAGLDFASRKNLFNILIKLNSQEKKTIIVISHNMDDVIGFAKRLIVIHSGKIVADGEVTEVLKDYENMSTFGVKVPEINILMKKLQHYIPSLNKNIYTVENAKKEILRILKKSCVKGDLS